MGGLNLATPGGLLELFGVIIALIGVLLIVVMRGKGIKATSGTTLAGVLIFVLGFVVVAVTPAAVTNTPPATTQTVNTLLGSYPALPSGESWNSATNTLTIYLVYNYTASCFAVSPTNASTTSTLGIAGAGSGCGTATGGAKYLPNYVLLPLKLVRTDNSNTTAAFPLNVASIPTTQSLGSTPTTYSFIGYKPATSTTTGQWQVKWSAGTTAGLASTVNAPSVTTNIASDSLAVSAFNSAGVVLEESLSGGNSTSAPSTFYSALTVYGSYNAVISIGNSNPTQITETFVVLGEHA
jgi:hypothetical protein